MKHTLSSAAEAVAMSKSTIYRAVKAGRLSATRNEDGEYQIDPAELHRVYEPVAPRAAARAMTRDATADDTGGGTTAEGSGAAAPGLDRAVAAHAAAHAEWLQHLVDDQRRQLREKDEVIADQLRIMEDRDTAWRRRFESLEQKLLPAPEPVAAEPVVSAGLLRRLFG